MHGNIFLMSNARMNLKMEFLGITDYVNYSIIIWIEIYLRNWSAKWTIKSNGQNIFLVTLCFYHWLFMLTSSHFLYNYMYITGIYFHYFSAKRYSSSFSFLDKSVHTEPMVDFAQIFSYLRIILFGLIFLIAFVYAIPIISIRQFHHAHMILTLNICLVTGCCCFYWFIFYIMLLVDVYGTYAFLINSCIFVSLVPAILTLQVPLSFVTVSINRFCSVVYHTKDLFKTKRWVFICILSQWIFGTLVILPILLGIQPVRIFYVM